MALLKGTLDVLVLKTLSWAPMHAFEITNWLETRTDGRIVVDDAALLQALHRMEERKWIVAEWGVTKNGRRALFRSRRVQVKSVRGGPWYVRVADYKELADQVPVYVIIGKEDCRTPVRYFIAHNGDVAEHVTVPKTGKWTKNGFINLRAVKDCEDRWELLDAPESRRARARR